MVTDLLVVDATDDNFILIRRLLFLYVHFPSNPDVFKDLNLVLDATRSIASAQNEIVSQANIPEDYHDKLNLLGYHISSQKPSSERPYS